MTYESSFYPHIRQLHDSPQCAVELYLVRHGEQWGSADDVYVNTYQNQAEAERFIPRILAAERSAGCDVGYHYRIQG